MKLAFFGLFTVLLGCGQTLDPAELIVVRVVESEKESTFGSGEDILGIRAKKKDQQGSLKSLSAKKGGEPANVNQAFGSYIQFVSPSTNSKCSGVLSFERDPSSRNMANIHFNTAVHCFEKVNPLGIAEIQLSKNSIQVGSAALPPEAYVRPFQASNKVKKNVSYSKAEVLVDSSGKPTDAMRLLVGQERLSQAQKNYLPTCDGFTSSAKDKALQAMGWAPGSESLTVASMRLEGLQMLPQFILDLFSLGGEAPQVYQLTGVSSFPGESGGPIFLVDGREDVDRVNGYECVYGVISREVVEPVLTTPVVGAGPANGFTLNVNSYFTPLTARSMGAQWRELK